MVLRAHPITFIPWIFNSLVLLTLLIIADIFFKSYLAVNQLFLVNIFIVVFIISYIFFNILIYIFNVGIVTNLRAVDVDFYAVIYKEVTEAKLAQIEDITAKSGGYFASLFNFGDLFIQTAGEEVNIEFLKVPRPGDAISVINNLLEA